MASTAIAVRDTRLVRWLKALRLIRVTSEDEFRAGADYANGSPMPSAFDPLHAMSALGAFPWVVACVNALATDLAGLPIRVQDRNGQAIDGHPVLALLDRPASAPPYDSGVLFRRQMIADIEVAGESLTLVARGTRGPTSLLRMHPARVEIRPTAFGMIGGYQYNALDAQPTYSPDDVLHVRGISWEDDPTSLHGSGVLRALNRELLTDLEAVKRMQKAASRGRPSAVYSPASKDMPTFGPVQMEEIRAALERMMRDADGGIAILGAMGTIEALGWSPSEMEYSTGREATRAAILAAFGVPPMRVGLPGANYATDRQQARTYWEGLIGKAALIDVQFTRLARMYGQDVSVYHDFGGVDALQDALTDNLQRVTMHITNGLLPADAYEAEGFTEIAAKLRKAEVAPVETDDDAGEATPNVDTVAVVEELQAALAILRDGDGEDLADVAGSIEEALALLAGQAAA